MKSPKSHLNFILDTLQSISDHTPNVKDDFMSDANAQDATIMRLQDIGEQLSHIRDQYPDYFDQYGTEEWHKLIGLRNIISHGYHEIDFEIIWNIVEAHLTGFEAQIRQLTNS